MVGNKKVLSILRSLSPMSSASWAVKSNFICQMGVRTKLMNQCFDSKLAAVCTLCNWKTVVKLLEMAK